MKVLSLSLALVFAHCATALQRSGFGGGFGKPKVRRNVAMMTKYPFSRKYHGGYIRRMNRARLGDKARHPGVGSEDDYDVEPRHAFGRDGEVPFDELDEDEAHDFDDNDAAEEAEAYDALQKIFGIKLDIPRPPAKDAPREPRARPHGRPRSRTMREWDDPHRGAGEIHIQIGGSAFSGASLRGDAESAPRRESQTKAKASENFALESGARVTFADVGGYTDIKSELMQCVDMLANHTKYARFNVRTPRGVVFEGPPGCGKTLLARALAGEADVAFIAVSGAQFQEKYVGVGAARVRELFDLARKNTPCIVFIDEIDALGRARSSDADASNSERDNSLNELLVQLDGFSTGDGVLLVAATNRADLLDPALVRPGRVDKRFFVGKPDPETRRAVITMHARGKPFAGPELPLESLVLASGGMSCSEIENTLNEAMLAAIRDDREFMRDSDIDAAFDRHLAGFQPSDHVVSDDMLDRICVHELGHAAAAIFARNHAPVRKVAINLRSPNSPGYTVFDPVDAPVSTREALYDRLVILLAGRAAEETVFGASITTGASADFAEAAALADKMVLQYGMGADPIYYGSSETARRRAESEVSLLLTRAREDARRVCVRTRGFIEDAAYILKTARVLSLAALEHIIYTRHPDLDLPVRHPTVSALGPDCEPDCSV